MKEEFNLSDKAVKDLSNNPIPNYYWEKDVKEFIKRLKENGIGVDNQHGQYISFQILDTLAGSKLIEEAGKL